jgi:transcriptional regulator with XRE-family HTH domain
LRAVPSPLRVNLRPFRERAGLSQSELARRSGVPQPAISRYEAGGTPTIRLEHLARLAAALGVRRPGDLLAATPKTKRGRRR